MTRFRSRKNPGLKACRLGSSQRSSNSPLSEIRSVMHLSIQADNEQWVFESELARIRRRYLDGAGRGGDAVYLPVHRRFGCTYYCVLFFVTCVRCTTFITCVLCTIFCNCDCSRNSPCMLPQTIQSESAHAFRVCAYFPLAVSLTAFLATRSSGKKVLNKYADKYTTIAH